MTTDQRRNLIWAILEQLKIHAAANERHDHCTGETFFSLVFKTDAELTQIGRAASVL